MNKRNTLIQEIETLITKYHSNLGFVPNNIDREDKGLVYRWQQQTMQRGSNLFNRLDGILKFVSESELEKLKKQFEDLDRKINNPTNSEITIDDFCELIDNVGKNIKLYFPNEEINNYDFHILVNKIGKFNFPSIKDFSFDRNFENFSKKDLDFFLKNFINLYNSDFIEDEIVRTNLVDQTISNIEQYVLSKDQNTDLIDRLERSIDENKELKLAINNYLLERERKDEELKNSNNELKLEVGNLTVSRIVTKFDTESNKNRILIILYSIFIIMLFIIIVLLISAKVIFYFCPKFDLYKQINDPYFIFCFFSLIISISALLTYLIRERKRLIILHDYYKRIHLELDALPEYMVRLTEPQRQELVIDLAKNYFTGLSNDNKSNQSPESDNASEAFTYLKILSDNIKSLNDKLTK